MKLRDDLLLPTLANVVRTQRQQLGISQKELAERSGLHPTYVSEMERGIRNLSIKSLNQLAGALEIPLSKLMILAEDSEQARGRVLQILLIEDSQADVHLITTAMKRGEWPTVVNVVEDGTQALSFLRRTGEYKDAVRPHLIILDLNLPKRDGRDVLCQIKEDASLRDIPVIVLTISGAKKDMQESYELYANCFITKPVDLNEFLTTMAGIQEYWFNIVKLPEINS